MKKKNTLILLLLILPGFFFAQDSADEKKENTNSKETKSKTIGNFFEGDVEKKEGLFNLYQESDKLYFEIDKSLLEEEILIVSRIKGHVKGLNFGGAGMRSRPQQVIRWQKHGNKILLRSVSYNAIANEEDPIYQSVVNNNFEPILLKLPY